MKAAARFHKLFEYLFYSVLSTILDVIIVWILYLGLKIDLTVSNTAGVVAGFILDYFLSSKRVFEANYGISAFLIYFGTFLFGLLLADTLITVSNRALLPYCSETLAFLISKGISIVLPFFVLYFARKFLYATLNRRGKDTHE